MFWISFLVAVVKGGATVSCHHEFPGFQPAFQLGSRLGVSGWVICGIPVPPDWLAYRLKDRIPGRGALTGSLESSPVKKVFVPTLRT